MATERQLQLEQAFRRALKELGPGVSTEFLIAATSERTKADPREIIEAVEVLNRRLGSQRPNEGTGSTDEDTTTLLLALGKAVTAIWSNLPQDVQHELFEHAVSAQDDATRERLAVFLHSRHFRTTDGIKARALPEPDSLGGNPSRRERLRRGVSLRRPCAYRWPDAAETAEGIHVMPH